MKPDKVIFWCATLFVVSQCALNWLHVAQHSDLNRQLDRLEGRVEQVEHDMETMGAALRMFDQRLDDTALFWPVLP